MIVVADLYHLGRIDGKYDKSTRKLKRKGAKVTESWIDRVNLHTFGQEGHGKLYVVDQEATKKWQKDNKAHSDEILERRRKEKEGRGLETLNEITEAINTVVEKKTRPVKKQDIER